MAGLIGLPLATVTTYDRYLLEGGLRTTGGRGRNAAKVTKRDAVHLLVAILGSEQIQDAVQTVKMYQGLPVYKHSPSYPYDVPEICNLEQEHTFFDAIEAALSTASVRKETSAKEAKIDRVTLSARMYSAQLNLIYEKDVPTQSIVVYQRSWQNLYMHASHVSRPLGSQIWNGRTDIGQERWVTSKTVEGLRNAFREEGTD